MNTARLIQRLHEGDATAADELLPMIYEELHHSASRYLARERSGHTLQPTALVNEAWIRLAGSSTPPEAESRVHFLRIAARAMRQVLVDHARAKAAGKRGTKVEADALEPLMGVFEEHSIDVLALHEALEQLAEMGDQRAQIVELRYFAGLTEKEVADVLGVSRGAVQRGWRAARAWLRAHMDEPG